MYCRLAPAAACCAAEVGGDVECPGHEVPYAACG